MRSAHSLGNTAPGSPAPRTPATIAEFFAKDIERGRSSYQLPCVLELLVPAEDYPDLVLEEINACRAELGEEPLTAHNRPSLKRRPTPVQSEPTPSSDRPTDCSPGDGSDAEVDGSVRGTSSTGEQTRQKPRIGIFGIIDRIPNIFLTDPVADRERLAMAVEKLLRQGLGEAEARALLSGLERLRNPFPALMRRLYDMRAAHRYLKGSLGRGVHGSGLPPPPWPEPNENTPDTQPEQFPVDGQGKATGTCLKHESTRNIPGGTCAICGQLCRSEPGQLLPQPVPELNASPKGALVPETPDLALPEDVALDPKLLGRITASMNKAGRALSDKPALRGGPWLPPGSGTSPKAQSLADSARERIKKVMLLRLG